MKRRFSFGKSFTHQTALYLTIAVMCATHVCGMVPLNGAEPPPAKFEPAGDRVYHGASLPGFWSDADLSREMEQFQQASGKKLAMVKWFASVYENGRLTSWRRNHAPHLERVKRLGAVSLVQFSIQDFAYDNSKKIASPPDIARGVFDAYFAEVASSVKEFNHPVFISLNPEMNGNWYPYSQAYAGTDYTAADYVNMWRHIVDLFRQHGANNVAWVWAPGVTDVGGTPFTAYYPGDAYVDWVGATLMSGNQTTALDTLYNTYASSKPIVITEWATSAESSRYNSHFPGEVQWVNNFFHRLETRYRRVKAIVWFQWNKDDGNFLLQRSKPQQAAYSQRIGKERYSGDAGRLLEPVEPMPPKEG